MEKLELVAGGGGGGLTYLWKNLNWLPGGGGGCISPVRTDPDLVYVGFIFAEFKTSLKLPKIDIVKNKPYYMSSLRVLEIAKIGLGENLTDLPSVIFAQISRRKKFRIYGNLQR